MSTDWLQRIVQDAHQRLLDTPLTHPAHQYLARRGVTPQEIRTYKLGYFGEHFQVYQCSAQFWPWFQRYGWDRLVFPLTDPFGTAIGMQVRHLGDKGYENFTLKPPEVYPPCFGLHVALPAMFDSERVVLVEGIFDYFAAVKVAPDALACLTANVSRVVRRIVQRYCVLAIALLDMDASGRRGAYRLAGLEVPPEWRDPKDVSLKTPPVPPYQVVIPDYTAHDPADLLAAGKVSELRRLVSPRVLALHSSASLPPVAVS